MLDGTDADGEWSDEEAVRSGSNTGVSETEADDNHPSVTIPRPQSSLGMMTSRPTYSFLSSDSLGHKNDPVTSILDRIDAEIEMMEQTPSLPSPPHKNGKHRNGSSSKSNTFHHNGTSSGPSAGLHIAEHTADTETGLGLSSLRGNEGSNTDMINGVAEIYSEACMTDGQTDDDGFRRVSDAPSDLDSVAAQQIDTKFKEIMRKKKDDPEDSQTTRHRPRRRKSQPQSRVHFFTPPPQFRDGATSSLPPDLPIHPGKRASSLTLTPRLRQNRTRPSATMLSTGYGTDNDSIRTEDFETKFNNLLVTSDTEKQPEVVPPPKQGILSNSTKGKDFAEKIPKSNDTRLKSMYSSDSALNAAKTEEDDILQRLMNIANGPSPTNTNHAPSSSHAPQGPSSPRPRSLSPSRLSLRKQHTSGDIPSLWNSSGSGSSLKTAFDESFWANAKNRSSNNTYYGSRRSPSVQSSSSNFDEVESLNFSSRSSNDSYSLSHDRGLVGSRNRASGIFIGRDRALYSGGGVEGGWGGEGIYGGGGGGGYRGIYDDLHKTHLSRQSSTTSTSTSPSSGNLGSSEASHSSAKDMALAKTLVDFLDNFGSQGNLGPADKASLQKLTTQIIEWDLKNSGGTGRSSGGGEVASSVRSKSNKDSYTSWSESGSVSSFSGLKLDEYKHRDEHINGSVGDKHQSRLNEYDKTLSSKAKRRRDLIIPDGEENAQADNDYAKNLKSDSMKSKDEAGSALIRSLRKIEDKDKIINESYNSCYPPDKMHGEQSVRPSRRGLMPARSFNKSSSFDSNASPVDGYNPFGHPFSTNHAERVLMGLGFGGKEGFLPERFLRDWYSKLSVAQDDQQPLEIEGISEDKENHLVKDVSSKYSSQNKSDKKPHDSNRGSSQPLRQDSISSSQLDESSNFPPRGNGQDGKNRQITEFLSALSSNNNAEVGNRESRINNFANFRQKSLPLFLETLSEEDEKSTRVPGVDPFDKEAKLQMFITDVMSSSGKSTGSVSENSIPSSNMSECDTQSSSSDGQNLAILRNLDEHKRYGEKQREQQRLINKFPNGVHNMENGCTKSLHKPSPKASPKSRKGAKLVRQDKKVTESNSKIGPSDREIHFSTDSLEVADILRDDKLPMPDNSTHTSLIKENDVANSTRNPMLKSIEPAMVSIVLEDVDEGKSSLNNRLESTRAESGRLSVPYSGSSMSLSPIPQSPVTVIEVGLDNTQDSIDTEDGISSSRENHDYSPQNVGQTESSPSTVSCDNCGNELHVKSRRTFEVGFRKDRNRVEDDALSLHVHNSNDLNKNHRERKVQKRCIEISKENATAHWINSSDESSYEGSKHQRENRFGGQRSPSLCNRRKSNNSPKRSPCQSPSHGRRNKEVHSNSCHKRCIHSTNSQRTSLSPTPISAYSENVPRRVWVENAYPLRKEWHNLHCCNKYTYHCDQIQCDFHRAAHPHHHIPYQCHNQCCLHYRHSLPQSPQKDTSLYQSDCFKNGSSLSAHSSPRSLQSAFKSPRKDKDVLLSPRDESLGRSEVSETDQDEFPSNVTVSLNPRSISANTNSMLGNACLSNDDIIVNNVLDSLGHHHQSPLIFSDASYSLPTQAKSSKGKVHQISRAVQACLPNGSNRMVSDSFSDNRNIYLACDREVQCSLSEDSKDSGTYVNKYAQTHIENCEVSCQTIDGASDLEQHKKNNDSSNTEHFDTTTSISKSVNTVISLIGDEHSLNAHNTRLVRNYNTKESSRCHEYQLVDDTLDLIEMELVAIENKSKKNVEFDKSLNPALWNPLSHLLRSSSQSISNSSPVHTLTDQKDQPATLRNRIASIVISQSPPSFVKNRSMTTNTSLNIEEELCSDMLLNKRQFETDIETKQHAHNFDIEKEMTAYLKPCQGMYDGASPPESFRSSPFDGNSTPSFVEPILVKYEAPHVAMQSNNIEKPLSESNAIEKAHCNSLQDEQPEETTPLSNERHCIKTQNVISSSKRGKSPLLKGQSTPIISDKEFHKDFLRIPSCPHEHTSKARYPASSRPAPPSTMASSPEITLLSVPARSFSLNDISGFAYSDIRTEHEYQELLKKMNTIKLNSNVDTATPKSECVELNSDISEAPRSSSRDSLTEVSVLSSIDGPVRTQSLQSLQYNVSSDSTQMDAICLEKLHLPEGVEFSLSCPHSNWEGLYGYSKLRASRMGSLLRAQTNVSDKHLSLYSMDALSDKSIAGSEVPQDIDEFDVFMSQKGSFTNDSDSSYSDLENDMVDQLSEASTCSVRNEKKEKPNTLLCVSDDQYDLLQISDCGESNPSHARVSPCFENHDPIQKDRSETISSSVQNLKITTLRDSDHIVKDCDGVNETQSENIEEIEVSLKDDRTFDRPDNIGMESYIDAPSVFNCSDVNLPTLSSPDYDIVPEAIFYEHDSRDSVTAGIDKLGNFKEFDYEPMKESYPPSDTSNMRHLNITPPEEIDQNATNDIERKKQNLLRTFQTAEFDSLLKKAIPGETASLELESGMQNCAARPVATHTLSFIDLNSNAHVLSVETEDESDNQGREIDCSIEDCNIMDELEIIALFKNMEHLNDRDNSGYISNACSPYPLSEIPEEETQSEESLTIDHHVCSESNRIVMAQETQESVLEGAGGIVVNGDLKIRPDEGFDECCDVVKEYGPDLDHTHDIEAQNIPARWQSSSYEEKKEVDDPLNFHNSTMPMSSTPLTELEKTTFKEERTYSSGLVYYCNYKSQTTQKTVVNFDSPSKPSQNMKATEEDSKDGGHLATMSLTVGDYRDVASTRDEVSKSPEVLSPEIDPKKKSPRKQLVKTMYSQSLSDDSPCIFMSTKHNHGAQGSKASIDKRLRSRESLLLLHDQKKCTGSDSDSEITPQETQEESESESETGNADFLKSNLSSFDENSSDDNMFSGFLTYGDTSFNPWKGSLTNSNSDSKKASQSVSSPVTKSVTFAENDSQSVKDTKVNPRVIIQQPSDDIPFWDTVSWRKAASPPPSYEEASASDHHLHHNKTFEKDSSRTDVDNNQLSRNPSRQSTGLWTRRTNQSSLLSPSLALLNNAFKEPAPLFRKDYSVLTDDSHPELDYLDLIPKFNEAKRSPSSSNTHLSLPLQATGVVKPSDQAKAALRLGSKIDCETSGEITGNDEKDSVGKVKPSTSSKIDSPIYHDQNGTKLNFSSGIDCQIRIVEKEAQILGEKGERNDCFENACPNSNSKFLSMEEIDEFLKPETYDSEKGNDILSSEKIQKLPDSADSSDPKFVSVVSRDSGFESRGSPIEQPVLKGSQAKNSALLSGVEFADDNV